MKSLVKYITLIIVSMPVTLLYAQQEPGNTNYMYNTQLYNPAYVGSRQAISAIGQYRAQWVGYQGAPTTQSLAINSPMSKNRLGLGLSLTNDKIGPLKYNSINVDAAYHLPVSASGKLSFGLKSGINTYNANFTSIKLEQENDMAYSANIQSKAMPNVGFGLYYYTSSFYAGLSSPQFLSQKITGTSEGKSVDLYNKKNHFYVTMGYIAPVSDRIDFKPTVLFKTVGAAPLQMDLTASFLYNKMLYAGLNFRSGESLGALAGITILNSLMLGYSYDWTVLNHTNSYNSGSHELILRYDFVTKKDVRGEFIGHF